MLSIGGLSFSIPCVLAPISGVSDLPFRMINRSFGAPFAFTEMIDVKAVSVFDKRIKRMLASNAEDRPLGVQLLAIDSKDIDRALKSLDNIEYDLLDLNAACSTPKVVRKGKGASLLKEPRKLKKILETLVRHTKTPVTVKIRSGWDIDSVNALDVALCAEGA